MRFVLAMIALSACAGASAEVYRWVDENGTVHFSDSPNGNGGSEQVEIREINSAKSVEVDRVEREARREQDVVMYSASWCGYCDQARAYFEDNDIPFEEYDVETSPKGRRDYAEMGGNGVPVILIGDRRMVGFSAERFAALYRR